MAGRGQGSCEQVYHEAQKVDARMGIAGVTRLVLMAEGVTTTTNSTCFEKGTAKEHARAGGNLIW